jgi:uncharacterized protein (TIGR00255 family)
MIKSMTGFASVTREDERASVGVTIRAVNHRYLDVQLRLPQSLSELEPRLRSLAQHRVGRGRLEISVNVQFRERPQVEVELNEQFAAALAAALERTRETGLVVGPMTPSDLLRFPQALTIRERVQDADAEVLSGAAGAVERAVEEALVELDSMRTREGEFLREDIEGRRLALGDLVERIAVEAVAGQHALEARLTERVGELMADVQIEQSVIAQEIVRTAARTDISEEVVRFRAHLAQWAELTDGPEPCGRKLDFLVQEMHREINTMGSKASGAGVSQLIVTAKAELEKIREQVQNVE